MEELAVLVGGGGGGGVGLGDGVDELEDEGAARADVVAAGEEVAADEGFEDAGLAAALAPHHRHLGEIDGGVAPHAREYVLQLVHYRDHGRAQGSRTRRRR